MQAFISFCLTMSQRGNAEKPCESKGEAQQSENLSLNSFNLLSSKQANNNLCDLENELHKCVLATKMNDIRDFVNAKDILANILHDIANGTLTVTSTLRAVFVGAYSKAIERLSNKSNESSYIEETANRERPVPFYNWLNERHSRPQINSA
ncbi:hypothetical protein ACQKOF_19390 [Lysinibacillus sp. NPDC093190]|uniref:hypothetical protein n=1 Tax=Lysinibacillus sp. NPDC093190 TaxID=3390575 RepID=UPI003D0578C2